MMINALVPVVAAIIGALVYALSANPKAAELGRVVFLAALIALMIYFAGHSMRLP